MNIGNSQNSNSFTTQSSASDSTNTLIPMASIKTEEGVNYFQGHIWNNKAPIFIGQESEKKSKKSVKGKTNVFTYFKAAKVPVSYRNDLIKQAVEYKGLSDDDRASYIEARVVTKACTDKLHPALLDTNGAFAARDLEAWQLLGHYAGRLKTEDQYQQGPEQLGGTRVSVDRYSYYLTKRLFLSGFRESNAMSLINANTTHKALRALVDSEDKTAIEAAKAEDAAKSPAANVVFVEQRDQKRWVILLVTRKDIAKGEQLFVDYGVEYWKHHEYVEDLERRQLFCQYCGLVSPNLDFYETHQKTEHETKNHTTISIPNLPSRESGRWNPGSETTENVSQCDVSNIVPESSNNPEDNNLINTVVKCSPPLDTVHQEPPVNSNVSSRLGQDDTDDDLLQSQSITSQKTNQCSTCGKELGTSNRLKNHRCIHTGLKLYKCDICGKRFAQSSTLGRHRMIHTGERPFKCDICGKSFTQSSTLGRHRIVHMGEKPCHCEVCDYKCFRQDNMSIHMRIHIGEKPYKCDICGKGFGHRGSLNRHMPIHTGLKLYKCDICEQMFMHPSGLNRHMRIHTGLKRYKCDICGKSFTQSSTLGRHRKVHTGEKAYMCDICGKGFGPHRGNLNRHMRIHTGERPYQCDICDKQFRNSGTLRTHKDIHTGDKRYKCDICEKMFIQNSSLKKHMDTHTGLKLYKCDICGKSFARSSTLGCHRKVHTGEKSFKCGSCGKAFAKKFSLINHELTHTGKKLCHCKECDYKCFRKDHLIIHMRTHTREKPYKCDICGKGFKHKTNRKNHQINKHTSNNK